MRQPERRRSRRIRIGEPLRLRPSDPKDGEFEEISRTKNVSREGIYFISTRASYYLGMRLFVTVPYHSPEDPAKFEQIAQVVRVEELGDGERGVAILLLSTSGVKPGPSLAGAKRE